ncbi:endonuclease domain-containing protein [Kribbella sp. NPDC051587]|uniref:endonuclease domain-containing protein n=1 Tax=Kribbella sp. NPDC051587 TaxID=3364119 RepID=UPI00379DD401
MEYIGRGFLPRRRMDLLSTGVTRAQLESGSWVSPHFGYHRSTQVRDPIRQRILDAVAVMPYGGVLGGWASAYLQGVTTLDGGWGSAVAGQGRLGEPVLVAIPPNSVVNRSGIRSLRAALGSEDVTEVAGIRCTVGVRTAYDLMRFAPDLTEAVVAGDCLIHAGLADPAAIAAYEAAHSRRRGVRQLREAIPLLNGRAASPPESRLRMICRAAGLTQLLVNAPVHDLDGRFLGIVDLLEAVAGLALEYDGEYHWELGQQTRDNHREENLERSGLTVLRVTALDLRNPSGLITRIQAAHSACLASALTSRRWLHHPRVA